ncbi:MAG: patatin-like phospholipase family protein [Deltaproteobacteria bacterium]|nr:patatin-like phospholipase family protein [Deltaproteobacteria bacterium]
MTEEVSGRTKRVALVIGSGSLKCAAALGVKEALQRADIGIDMVVGCSGGSQYATFIALGYNAEKVVDLQRNLWTSELTRQRSVRALLGAILPRLFGFSESFGLVDDTRLYETLKEMYGNSTFSDTVIPLYLTATDFTNGEQVVFSKGKLVDVIRASMAIPYIFKPWRVGDRLLVDGYLSDPLPIGVAIKEGADLILAMGFESSYMSRIDSLFRFSGQIGSIMVNKLLKANYSFYTLAHHFELIPVIPQFDQPIMLFDTDKIPYIIEEGERAAEEQIPYIHRLLDASRSQ